MARARGSVFSRDLLLAAIGDSFPKLDPRAQFKNPVMFIVELGSVVTTGIFLLSVVRGDTSGLWFVAAIAIWLWLTVLFANFAEAIAEGRGKAQASALRATRTTTNALLRDGRSVPAAELQRGDVVVVEAGEIIPADGEIIDGVGSVDESAITGESAPVIRESGGDRSAVTGGTKLLVRQARDRGDAGARQVLPRPHDRPRRGCGTPQDPERDRPQHPPLRPDDHLRRRRGNSPSVRALRRDVDLADGPDRPARRADPDDDRRTALRDRDRRHGPARAAECPRDVGSGRRGIGRRRRAAARQDGHDHARQPPGRRVPAGGRCRGARARRGRPAGVPGRRDAGGTVDRRAGEGAVRPARADSRRARVRPVQRHDAYERREHERHADPQGCRRRGQAVHRRAGRERARRPGPGRAGRRRAGRHTARRCQGQLRPRRRST